MGALLGSCMLPVRAGAQGIVEAGSAAARGVAPFSTALTAALARSTTGVEGAVNLLLADPTLWQNPDVRALIRGYPNDPALATDPTAVALLENTEILRALDRITTLPAQVLDPLLGTPVTSTATRLASSCGEGGPCPPGLGPLSELVGGATPAKPDIVSVNKKTFGPEVVDASKEGFVVVDLWVPW